MKFNQFVAQSDFTTAFQMLVAGIPTNPDGTNFIKPVPENISCPAFISQEQPFIDTQSTYTFEFGTNAPAPSATLNNIILGQNNAMVVTGFQILLGYGANVADRTYYSRGFTAADNSIYNAIGSMVLESNNPVQKMDMQQFYEEGDFINQSGFVPIKPLRVLTGLISRWQFVITFPQPIAALTLSSNLFIRVKPWGAIGFA